MNHRNVIIQKIIQRSPDLKNVCIPDLQFTRLVEMREAIYYLIDHAHALTTLSFNYTLLDDRTCAVIGELLEKTESLTKLSVSACKLSDKECTSIVRPMTQNTTVTCLALDRNHFGDEGGVQIAKMLRVNTTLLELNIQQTQFDDIGAVKIARALNVNSTLQTLNMSVCKMTGDVFVALGDALQRNSSLTDLNISYPHGSADSNHSEYIFFALHTNATLVSLNMCGCKISTREVIYASHVLKSNTTLEKLHMMSSLYTEEESKWSIVEAMKENSTMKDLMILWVDSNSTDELKATSRRNWTLQERLVEHLAKLKSEKATERKNAKRQRVYAM